MKISHIIALLTIAVAIGIILSASGDASKYVTFKEASAMAKDGDNDKVHVVGKLKKDQNGNVVGLYYAPTKDPNLFYFILLDNNNEEKQVVYYHPKPQDFEKSEQVVVVGSMKDEVFVASEILMKCPSKYENEKVEAGSQRLEN
jgi:cytochrome c-type biogenesis protein CcmE